MKKPRNPSRGPLERAARAFLRDAARSMARVERTGAPAVAAAAEAAITCLAAGGRVYFCGNGGSAADAQHLACELAGRFLINRPALPAVALSTNTSSLTAIGNDFGYDEVFSRQLEGLGEPGDVLVAITTSGTSSNVLRAVHTAQRLGMTVIGMTGPRAAGFAAECDIALIGHGAMTPHVQEGHIAMGHAWCQLVESALFPGGGNTGKPRRAAKTRARTKARRP